MPFILCFAFAVIYLSKTALVSGKNVNDVAQCFYKQRAQCMDECRNKVSESYRNLVWQCFANDDLKQRIEIHRCLPDHGIDNDTDCFSVDETLYLKIIAHGLHKFPESVQQAIRHSIECYVGCLPRKYAELPCQQGCPPAGRSTITALEACLVSVKHFPDDALKKCLEAAVTHS